MKTFVFSLLISLTFVSSCTTLSNKNSQEFSLQGKITGQDQVMLILSYYTEETSFIDTSRIENGRFKFEGKLSEPTLAVLRDKNDINRAFIYLEPRVMKISLSGDNFEEFTMTGSETQNESDLLNKAGKPFYDKILLLREEYNAINDSIENAGSADSKMLFEKKAEEIDEIWSRTREQIDSVQVSYVIGNPGSYLAIMNLRLLTSNEVLSLDSTKSIFNGFENSLKESSYGKRITEDIRKKENSQVGAVIPDINVIGSNDQTINLSRFRDKNVLLVDFWASWCVPCRESFQHLKDIYNKYHSEGLEIVAVAWMDLNNETWREAIDQEGIGTWHNVATIFRNGSMVNKELTDHFSVPAIPFTLLYDKSGKIIYRNVGYSKESEETLDKLLSEMF